MAKRYIDPDKLPWQNPDDKIFGYEEIREENPPESKMVYYFTGDKNDLIEGDGVLELQKKLSYVFRYSGRTYHLYKDFYMEKSDYREALTSGVYGPKTMELIMIFQSLFMEDHFKNNWLIEKGFGSFGPNTKKVLEEKFKEAYYIKKKAKKLSSHEKEELAGYRSSGY